MKKRILTAIFVLTAIASVILTNNISSRSKTECADIMMSNMEALSRGEDGEQACVASTDICIFHGLQIANSREYKH